MNSKLLGLRNELKDMLLLRAEPIALKMIKDENEVPAEAVRPIRDLSAHIAMCQAFGMTRRDKKMIYMDKSSEWCWAPLVGYGFVESGEDSEGYDLLTGALGMADKEMAKDFFAKFPRLPYGNYTGVLIAPLGDYDAEPDIILIYCNNNAQLRNLVWAAKNTTGELIITQLDVVLWHKLLYKGIFQ